jgi:hypothetical protein
VERVQLNKVKWRVGWWELWFSRCELLLLQAGSWGTGIIRESRIMGTSAVEASTRQRLVKTINPIINPNPIYSHSYTWQYYERIGRDEKRRVGKPGNYHDITQTKKSCMKHSLHYTNLTRIRTGHRQDKRELWSYPTLRMHRDTSSESPWSENACINCFVRK